MKKYWYVITVRAVSRLTTIYRSRHFIRIWFQMWQIAQVWGDDSSESPRNKD